MKRKYILLAFLVLLGIPSLIAQVETVTILSPEHFNRVIKLNPKAVIIDVRPEKDFKKGHIKGAYFARTSDRLFQIIDSLGTDKTYLLYCKYGERSIQAGKLIYEKFSIKTCSLEEGLDFWKEKKMEVVK